MQKSNGIKWGLLLGMLVLALSLCAACGNRVSPNHDNKGARVIEGYIVDFNSNRVTVDQVEFLTAENTSRINELGLDTTQDFQNGYYVHNDGKNDRKTYTLADNVQVRLADTAADGWYGGAQRNAAINNVSGYSPNNTAVGVNRDANNSIGISGTLPDTNMGMVNPVQHVGNTLGGTVGGRLGGVELLSNRYRDSITVNTKMPYFITIKDGYITNIEEVGAFSNFATNGYPATTGYPTTNGYPLP